MFCLSCTMPCHGSLCERCRLGLRPAPEVSIGSGLIGVAGFVHEGTARRLVHALKYRAVFAAAEPLADAMAERIPGSATALVPVPRAIFRAFRHGIDPAADYYSLGVTLFRAATGSFPFEPLVPQVLMDHINKPAPDPSSINPDIDANLRALILACLSKDPASRPSSPAAIDAVLS